MMIVVKQRLYLKNNIILIKIIINIKVLKIYKRIQNNKIKILKKILWGIKYLIRKIKITININNLKIMLRKHNLKIKIIYRLNKKLLKE